MFGRITPIAAGTGLTLAITAALAPAALAHEGRPTGDGDLAMVVGFGTEPAYAGQPNSVQLILEHDEEPVVDLGNTLDVEVSFGEETMALELEPNFVVGEFGEPGDYRAWFIPTRPGQYAFHFTGTIDGEDIDETFTSGPDTFSDVTDPAEIEFPVQDPTNGELAERIDQESERIVAASATADEARAAADQASADLEQASDDASSAQTMAVVGLVVGAVGLIVAVVAIVMGRRKTA
jgi:hypothetical protein